MLAPAFPATDLSNPDPIPAILASPEFPKLVQTFAESPSIKGALVSPDSQALLYSLIRLLRPQVAVEIGTYMASTTEAMARAIADNGTGMLHTVDPFGAEMSPRIIGRWSRELQNVTRLHLIDSMMFFAEMQRKGERTDLVFVDGNHDYEFALFDIQCAARLINAGGFIVIDNIAQPGPFFAARDFMERARSQGWRECGGSLGRFRSGEVFDKHRTTIHNTDFCILRAPQSISIGVRPVTFGDLPWTDESTALCLRPASNAAGRLHAQFIIRVFENPPREIIENASIDFAQGKEIVVSIPFPPSDMHARKTVEPWLTFEGTGDLRLSELPAIR
jgi:predicted O-methyltransferase YrrM